MVWYDSLSMKFALFLPLNVIWLLLVCLYEEVSQLLLLVVNISMKNTLALSTNAAPGIEGRTDVGDKCQLHLITPALCYIVHLYIKPYIASDYTHPMALPSPNFMQ